MTIKYRMIYGRKFFERKWADKPPLRSKFRGFHIVNSGFQWKYTFYILAAIGASLLLFLLPALYFLRQNYEIFYKLAYDVQPNLLDHLDREIIWLYFFWGVGAFSMLIFSGIIALKMTGSIIGPLVSMERHMRYVTLGDWSRSDFSIRSTDDFRSLANAYSYLYRTLKAHTEREIHLLEKIVVDPNNKEAYSTWLNLIEAKKSLINLETSKDQSDEQNLNVMGENINKEKVNQNKKFYKSA